MGSHTPSPQGNSLRGGDTVKRNIDRFPADFMFQLSPPEKDEVVANCDHLAKLKFSKGVTVRVHVAWRDDGGVGAQVRGRETEIIKGSQARPFSNYPPKAGGGETFLNNKPFSGCFGCYFINVLMQDTQFGT